MIVEVTQFMRPDGRQVKHELEVSDECKEKYEELLSCNTRLTAEQLMSGAVSQTIECTDGDLDFALTKGPDLEENKKELEKMILRFDKIACVKFQEGMSIADA